MHGLGLLSALFIICTNKLELLPLLHLLCFPSLLYFLHILRLIYLLPPSSYSFKSCHTFCSSSITPTALSLLLPLPPLHPLNPLAPRSSRPFTSLK